MDSLKKYIKDSYYYSALSVFAQWLISTFFLVFYYQVLHKTTVTFIGAKPDTHKNYVVVSNHRSMKDPPLLGHAVRLPIAFIAKKELFDSAALTTFMSLTSTISVDRESAEIQTFKEAKKALQSKPLGHAWSVGVFIEGTRSTDPERLGKPNKGPLFIARMAKAPIIPIGISYRGSNEIVVKIGEPYEIDYKRDLDEQAWECLEKISKLTDYKMPAQE